jgi:hypothetical protein
MVEIKSPVRLKDLEAKAGISFKALIGAKGSKTELYDTDKMLIMNLKKGECIVYVDRKDNIWELYRNEKGRYNLRKLKDDA